MARRRSTGTPRPKQLGAEYIEQQFKKQLQAQAGNEIDTDELFDNVETAESDVHDDLVFHADVPVNKLSVFIYHLPNYYPQTGAFVIYRIREKGKIQFMISGYKSYDSLIRWESKFGPPVGAILGDGNEATVHEG